jgi:predicted nucleotidyltransferase component of viral defense system
MAGAGERPSFGVNTVIAEAEVRRWAGAWATDPMIVDLDYVLGCFLSQWYLDEVARRLRFKGGTCLRKCYYPDYRFSEDLDFTAEIRVTAEDLQKLLDRTIQRVQDVFSLNLAARPPRFEIVQDEYGLETYQIRLYYRGSLRFRGDPRAIRLDISHDEYLGLSAVERAIIHPYSDRDSVASIAIPCYDLLEMLTEKLRALSGQRRYAIARDLYDLHQLLIRAEPDISGISPLLEQKFLAKGISLEGLGAEQIAARRAEFERDWQRNLQYLLPSTDTTTFEKAWQTCVQMLDRIKLF